MKHVVISEDFREFELHPPELFNTYLDITKNEISSLMKTWDLFEIDCPGCNSKKKEKIFTKFGMEYVQCQNCKTVYVTPRPSETDVSTFYKTSKSLMFWNEHFYKETILSRKRIILKPRALWVINVTENYFEKPEHFIDIKSKYLEFIDEVNNFHFFKHKTLIDPLIEANHSFQEQKNVNVINKPIESLSPGEVSATSISALEVIDRISNPKEFITKVRSLLVDNGLFFLTTSTISGFDLQILWDHSKSIYPLDHMNLFSIEGITELLTSCGFEIIELSTTGQLDLEIVKNAKKANPDLEVPRFISYLIEHRDEDAHRAFQEFLQQYNLSSHLRIAARKK